MTMSFKFNFQAVDSTPALAVVREKIDEIKAEEVIYITARKEAAESKLEDLVLTPDISLKKGVKTSQQASILLESQDLRSSDLVPGKYEGGLKLWECAVDLAKHLCERWSLQGNASKFQVLSQARNFEGRHAMELGCGHGLPGLLAAKLGMEVHFQDYNREVLTGLTMPNYVANVGFGGRGSPRFFSGGWASLKGLLQEEGLAGSYDYVFTTDSIYSLDSQQHLLDCIAECLKPQGVAFVAAKVYYFGVGGSSEGFKTLAREHGQFEVEDGTFIDDGSSNKREIFQLTKK